MHYGYDEKEDLTSLLDDVNNQSLDREYLTQNSYSIKLKMKDSELLSIASCDLKMDNERWMRPKIDNFEGMSFQEFCHFCNLHPKMIQESATGETSMKHASWKGSLNVPSPWKAVYTIMFIAL